MQARALRNRMAYLRRKQRKGPETLHSLSTGLAKFIQEAKDKFDDTPVVHNRIDRDKDRFVLCVSKKALAAAVRFGGHDVSLDTTFSLTNKGFQVLTFGMNDAAHR